MWPDALTWVFGGSGRPAMRRALSVALAAVLAAGAVSPVGASAQVDQGCVEALTGWGSVQSSWTTGCMSHAYVESQQRYARFFALSLDRETSVMIAIESTPHLRQMHLYRGHDLPSAEEIAVSGGRLRKTLPAGDYMIEATTYYQWRTGPFTLTVAEDVDPVPAVTIHGGIGPYEVGHASVTEGRSAVFTLSASPPPSVPLPVQVVVDQDGDFGVASDLKDDSGDPYRVETVIIPTSGRATLTVATVDDDVDEERGRVQVAFRVRAGWGYQHSGHGSSDFVYVLDNDPLPPPTQAGPEVSVAAGSGVSEGDDAVFTVTASPAPSQPLSVNLTVSQEGGFGASTGSRAVTVPTSGSATVTVATSDDNVNEPDGSVGVTVDPGGGYNVSGAQRKASVAVADDDTPTGCRSVAVLAAEARANHDALRDTAENRRQRNDWWRAWIALSGATGTHNTPLTAAEAREVEFGDSRWRPFRAALECLEGTPSPAVPVVTATAGSRVSEGGDAVFTVTASPAPSQPLTVNLTVGQWGHWGASTGSRTVTVPTSGSATVTVATSDDNVNEPDGSVGVTVDSGGGYTVSSIEGTAIVDVADDEGPSPVAPEIRIAAGSGVTEGGDAVFTVIASPAPSQPLSVSVRVAQTGDFGAATGSQTVTVPTSGTATVTVSTSDDSADEPDGWVTVSVRPGDGYAVESARGSASVGVADDDDLPVPDVGCTEALAGSGTAQGSWEFWCRSRARSGRFAQFFTFSLESQASVTIDLESKVDTYLYLRQGLDQRSASVVAQDDDGGAGFNSRIAKTLDAGDYTIEATTYSTRRSGPFTLKVSGVPAQSPNRDRVVPVVSVAAGSRVTEGGDASFTVSASPGPAQPLSVSVTVAQTGDFGVAAGFQTVTVPTSGTATVTVSTSDDSADEPDGSVSVAVAGGSGYTVSTTQSSASVVVADDDDPPPVVPEISVTADGDVTEGSDASFTVSASPAPSAPLTVDVTVSQSGDWGASTGSRTVTVPTSGSATVTVSTSDDDADEADGSVSVTVSSGSGYTVSGTAGSASVVVADDDDPPPVVPEVSVTAGSGVTEGADAQFTVTSDPAPAQPLTVNVTVAQSGDFGASTGSRTVTVPTSGTATVTVSTSDDDEDEPDGSVSVAVNSGDGYTVSGTSGSASVVVADDDDPPPVDLPVVSVSDASVAEGELGWLSPLEFRLALSRPADQNITVRYRLRLGTTSPSDHYGGSGRATIWAGRTHAAIVVLVVDDTRREPEEALEIELTGADGAAIDADNSTAVGTITDND